MSWIFLLIASASVVCCQHVLPNTVVERAVSPGENVTVLCDCKPSTGEHVVWYRNCSHENQPTFSLKWGSEKSNLNMMQNNSLLITNISDSHLGLYYCGTEEVKVVDGEKIFGQIIYRYGNVSTRISFASGIAEDSKHCARGPAAGCGQCWRLLSILCPTCALLLSLISSLVVYLCCRRTDEDLRDVERTPGSRDGTSTGKQDQDGLCYATLDLPLRSQRATKQRVPTSDLCTYSAIKSKRNTTKSF